MSCSLYVCLWPLHPLLAAVVQVVVTAVGPGLVVVEPVAVGDLGTGAAPVDGPPASLQVVSSNLRLRLKRSTLGWP